MISFIISLTVFLFTLSVDVLSLGAKVAVGTGKVAMKVNNKVGITNRIGNKFRNSRLVNNRAVNLGKRLAKLTKIAVKLALRALILLIRFISLVCTIVSIFIAIITTFTLMSMAVILGGGVFLCTMMANSEGGKGFSSISSSVASTTTSGNNKGNSSSEVPTDIQDLENAFNSVANMYIKEIGKYQVGGTTSVSKNDVFGGTHTYRYDCSGFASNVYAYFLNKPSLLNGARSSDFTSESSCELTRAMRDNGFTLMTLGKGKALSSWSDLNAYDLLVDGGSHVEFYLGMNKDGEPTHWGWGQVRSDKKPIAYSNYSNEDTWSDSGLTLGNSPYQHTYTHVWRYEGD